MWHLTERRSKYGSRRVELDGLKFDSAREARYYAGLKAMLSAGEIVKIERQVRWVLPVNNVKVCTYVSDFVVYDKDGNRRVIDVKGFKTPVYRIKRKLMKAIYGIDIEEV